MKRIIVFTMAFAGFVGSVFATDNQPSSGDVVTSKLYVDTQLDGKQKAIGSGPADANDPTSPDGGSGANGDVVTYTGTAGRVSSKPVYDETGSYTTAQQNALIEAKNVNTAVQNGLNQHVTCRDWAGNDPTSGDCWIWQINTNLNGTYVPHNVSTQ